ncbi:MAG: helix-hairpin-helix domain-containing protein [Cellulosilyticaceae bacterium]
MIKLLSKYKLVSITLGIVIMSCLITYNKFDKESTAQIVNELSWDTYVETGLPKNLETTPSLENISEKFPVYICGAVEQPGVYYVEKGSILNELVALAGGLDAEADPIYINLAKELKANEKIYVTKVGEKIDKTTNSYENGEYENELINLNEASLTLLDSLPGIGESRARQIIDYREANGPFSKIEDIKKVPGIGDKIFDSLKDFIRIE